MNRARHRAAFATVLAMTLAPLTASADPTKADDAYGYIFKDDILAADRSVLTAVPLNVLKHPRGGVLVRPRVQFVTEMLKSVENL